MNFVYPDINFVFNTTEKGVHTLVIENQSMFQTLEKSACPRQKSINFIKVL